MISKMSRWRSRPRAAQGLVHGVPPLDDEALLGSFRAHQLRILAQHGLLTLPATFLSGCAMAWMLWAPCSAFLTSWLVLHVLLVGVIVGRVRRNIHLDVASVLNVRMGHLMAWLLACLLGAFPIFTLGSAGASQQMVILLAMVALISTGAIVLQTVPAAATAWVLILVTCTLGSMWWQDLSYTPQIAVVAAFFSVILIRNVHMSARYLFGRTKLAHEAQLLSQSLALQAQVVQGTANGVLVLDKRGRVVWVNEGFTQRTGFAQSEVVGELPWALLSATTGQSDARSVWRSLRRAGQLSLDLQYLHKGGRWRWASLDIRHLRAEQGGRDGFMIIATDITELQQMTQALKAEQDRQTHIIDGTHCGTWQVDFDLGVGKVGGHWLDIIGVDTSTPIVVDGTWLLDRIHPDDRHAHGEAIRRYLSGQAAQFSHQCRVRHDDGTWHWIHARGKASVYSPDGRIEQLSGTAVDISDYKATELALIEATRLARQANEAKSLFLATMSHEIRTPMNGVVGTAEWLKHTKLDDVQRDGVHTIVDSGRALLTIIDDILDFSKAEAGRMSLTSEPVNIAELAEGVLDVMGPVAQSKHVDLHVFIDPRLPPRVMGDANRLRQVLMNLAGNAVKFACATAEKPGQVDVRVVAPEGSATSWRIVVSDDGIGMTADTLHNLFKPFSQADATITRRFGGTGLGLAICHRLVEIMGGEITADSQLGQGATFSVTLPLTCLPQRETELAGNQLRGIDCLLLAGKNFRHETFAAYLTHAGARVHCCDDVLEFKANPAKMSMVVVIRDTPDRLEPACADAVGGLHQPGLAIRHLLVGRYQRGPMRFVGSHSGQLGRAHVQDVLRAVAVMAGRKSAEIAPHDADAPEGVPSSKRQPFRGRHTDSPLLLIAEDDLINQKVIRRQLQILGISCEVVGDGVEALTRWRQGQFDLILSDLHMPEMDGYELARCIRTQEASTGMPRTPILALTANALKDEEARALACGMDAYLTKPIAIKELQRRLAEWLHERVDASSPEAPSQRKGAQPVIVY